MKFRFWGVRGSIPSPGPRTVRYGGNTTCLEVRGDDGTLEVAPPGLRRVFYSDSGATAVEIALKQSFQYWQLRGRGDKQRFLRLDEA